MPESYISDWDSEDVCLHDMYACVVYVFLLFILNEFELRNPFAIAVSQYWEEKERENLFYK